MQIQASGAQCITCPRGADCSSEGHTKDDLFSLPGWFLVNETGQFLQCLRITQCVGGQQQCAQYRTGPLCARCSPGYATSDFSDKCTACPSTGASTGYTFFFVLLILGM